jgi:hypothetical protein
MRSHLEFSCEQHSSPFDCPDALVAYSESFNEYGLIVHDGGGSFILISFCPWCGSRLPESLRARWFAELEALGFDDPLDQEIPEAYRTDAWYKERRAS